MDVNIHDAKSQLSKLIERALAGEDVVIAKRGKPVVRLVPIEKKAGLDELLGCLKDEITYEEGWDAPLEGDDLDLFHKDTLSS